MQSHSKKLLEAINNFKTLFTESKAQAFKSLEIDLMTVIEEYGNDEGADADILFRPTATNEYTKDKSIQINLTTLSVAINLVSNKILDNELLMQNIHSITEALKELQDDLTLFIEHDKNQTRQTVYKKAIQSFNTIAQCFN